MTAQELNELVEKVIVRVLQRIENDPELAGLISARNNLAILQRSPANPAKKEMTPATLKSKSSQKKLYTERDILEFAVKGEKSLRVSQNAILTPSALDVAAKKGLKITRE